MNLPFSRPTAKRSLMTLLSTLGYLGGSASLTPVDGGVSLGTVSADLLKTLLGGDLIQESRSLIQLGGAKFYQGK